MKPKIGLAVLGIILALGAMYFVTLSKAPWSLETFPLLEGGRLKPFDSFARESLRLIYGKDSYKDQEAREIVLTWAFVEAWKSYDLVRIDSVKIKKALLLDVRKNHFPPKSLRENALLVSLFEEVKGKQIREEPLTPFEEDIATLEKKLSLFFGIQSGVWPKVYPSSEGEWLSADQMPADVLKKYIPALHFLLQGMIVQKKIGDQAAEVRGAGEGESPFQGWIQEVQKNYPLNSMKMKLFVEAHYNNFAPFKWALALYLIALLLWILMTFAVPLFQRMKGLFLGSIFLGLLSHVYGLGLRMYVTGRAPVSNMYESVLWVSLISLSIALSFYFLRRRYFALIPAALVVCNVCLLLVNVATVILNPALDPLQPVLRDNFWLTVHVLTVCGSYAPFFLSFVLGLYNLFLLQKDKAVGGRASTKSLEISDMIYSSVKVGLVLLVAGTLLGGVWADYSWGRFWGWDPKETWALIVILIYSAILHGRLIGWMKPFLFSAAAVMGFLFVIMAWYGVNYILGKGLHSYGFGSGGSDVMMVFVGGVLVYLMLMWWRFNLGFRKSN